MDPLVLLDSGTFADKDNSWQRRGNTDKERLRRAAHSLSSALISFCIYNSPATSNVEDSSVFLSRWLVLWQCCVSVSHLCLPSFVLVSSKWDKAWRKRWMRAKKSNYSSTSMMEREAEGTAGISAPLTADTDSLQREFSLLWGHSGCVSSLSSWNSTFSKINQPATCTSFLIWPQQIPVENTNSSKAIEHIDNDYGYDSDDAMQNKQH